MDQTLNKCQQVSSLIIFYLSISAQLRKNMKTPQQTANSAAEFEIRSPRKTVSPNNYTIIIIITVQLQQQVSVCIDEVAMWMRCNRLQLNTAKTEVLWCASTSTSDSVGSGKDRHGLSQARQLRPGPWNLRRLRHIHQDPHLQDRLELLCYTSPAPQYSSFRHEASLGVAHRVTSPDAFGLRQRDACWCSEQPA